jgi:succinyl-diaminopimelate desuccinylase
VPDIGTGDSHPLAGDFLAALASRFVAVPSVNGEHPEVDLADVVVGELEPHGFVIHRVGDPVRPSIAAVWGAGSPDEGLVLNGHLDTVPVDDPDSWRHPPFGGVVADGAVHGRGACDMKGGLAIMVAVARWLVSRPGPLGRLVLHFAMGEERGEPGTESLVQAGFVAPAGIVLEPTDFQVGVAQRGLVTLRVLVEGRAGHASRRDLADNPIRHLPTVMGVLEALEAEATVPHPLLGSPTWTPTSVHAGVIPSMIPGSCEVLVDRRMLPGDTVESLISRLDVALRAALPGVGIKVEPVLEEGIYQPAEVPADGRVATAVGEALRMLGREPVVFGTPYSSDVRHLVNQAGIEAVTFGPGRFEDMHTRDELIRIGDLELGARVVAVAAANLLGVD